VRRIERTVYALAETYELFDNYKRQDEALEYELNMAFDMDTTYIVATRMTDTYEGITTVRWLLHDTLIEDRFSFEMFHLGAMMLAWQEGRKDDVKQFMKKMFP